MKNLFWGLTVLIALGSGQLNAQNKNTVQVKIDLNKIENDRVPVAVIAPKIAGSEVIYRLPKIIPGTYSVDNYGRFVEQFKAYDKKGAYLEVTKVDDNSWKISNASKLESVSYQVNDTYDVEQTHDIFSPAGSNIDAGKNILLNTHCFVGYFENYAENPYQLTVEHPENLWGATSLNDTNASPTIDQFTTGRYNELVENPIMYSKPDYTTFKVNGMDILIAVYSPHGLHSAQEVTPAMQTMMTAQKNFLGSINTTSKYSVLIYLSDMESGQDAQGFGALEHPTATTVVMPEQMPTGDLAGQLKDVVSHEFFHIVTPLTIHSKEIQNFDFASPKMSQHLWMYEGVTEYFANLFQVNQGLITEDDFLSRIASKMNNAANLNDNLPFTEMSANVLNKPYKDQYLNVYEKGALIGMCLDIIIREQSKGSRGILDLMRQLSTEYGVHKAFEDRELFDKITALTYPQVGDFLQKYVAGPTSIPYDFYLAKMGVNKTSVSGPGNPFIKGQMPTIDIDPQTKQISVRSDIEPNVFFQNLGIKAGDQILEVNQKVYTLDNIYELIMASQTWQEGDEVSVKIKRDGKEQFIKGKVQIPTEFSVGFKADGQAKKALRDAWLKG